MAKLYSADGNAAASISYAQAVDSAPPSANCVEDALCWYATYTYPRHEKAIADHLLRKSVEVFLPLYNSVRNWNGRRVRVPLPLFPGYVFVRIRASARLQVLEVPRVIRIIGFNGKLLAMSEQEIEGMRTAVEMRDARPCSYRPGLRVRINAGVLKGLEGTVVRQKGQYRFVISVDSIMRSFSVELDANDLVNLPRGSEVLAADAA